jgi:hypothetical protein
VQRQARPGRLEYSFYSAGWTERIGPWLLLDTNNEVLAILSWGNPSDEEMAQHERGMRQWSVSSVALNLTVRQLDGLIQRGRDWPWNGYELRKMKEAGRYPDRSKTKKRI